jgi:hypothetical protein
VLFGFAFAGQARRLSLRECCWSRIIAKVFYVCGPSQSAARFSKEKRSYL